jgi:CBS domain-containing protein
MAAKTARDIMTPECTCVGEDDTVLDAAKRLAELNAHETGLVVQPTVVSAFSVHFRVLGLIWF